MKIDLDLDAVLLDRRDKPLRNGDRVCTLGQIFADCLDNPTPVDAQAGRAEKERWHKLAKQLDAGGQQSLEMSDLVLIQDRVAIMYGAAVVGAVAEALERMSKTPAPPKPEAEPAA